MLFLTDFFSKVIFLVWPLCPILTLKRKSNINKGWKTNIVFVNKNKSKIFRTTTKRHLPVKSRWFFCDTLHILLSNVVWLEFHGCFFKSVFLSYQCFLRCWVFIVITTCQRQLTETIWRVHWMNFRYEKATVFIEEN